MLRSAASALSLALAAATFACADDLSALHETERDHLGLHRTSRNWQWATDHGARVVDLQDAGTFFLVWVPEGYAELPVRRVLVALHGTKGTAYAEFQDEYELARKNRYAVVAVQWYLPASREYLSPRRVYELADLALDYMSVRHGAQPEKAALVGFSRGSAISYEVTFWDRHEGTNHFVLTVAHSGGIPEDHPTPFCRRLIDGEHGERPLAGARFFLYAGARDEEWGGEMCEQIRYAARVVESRGASIERTILDPEGTHAGYRRTPSYHEDAMRRFLEATAR